MNVMWITNLLFPDVCHELGIPAPVIGGWMHASALALLQENKSTRLAIATVYTGKEFREMEIKGITYFLVPRHGQDATYNTRLESHWVDVKARFNPDVVHIHGTEYPHAFTYLRACGNKGAVVSIQGLVSVCQKYYLGGISHLKLAENITLRDIIRVDSVFNQQAHMYKRGLWERRILSSTRHVIGRTSWDKVHTWAINPQINYHFCNETLREVFYLNKWELEKCERYSIFISQAYYPLKGLHQLLHALPYVLREYPDTRIYIAGIDFITNKGLRLNGFGKYIRSLIIRYKLASRVVFTGPLSDEEMCSKYLSSHVFVCPSQIENSSNSVGEAQILGLPCVASYVGGTPDLVEHNETGLLYRFEETEMLAAAICRIFGDNALALRLSENGRQAALKRHNRKLNAHQLDLIYKNIVEK